MMTSCLYIAGRHKGERGPVEALRKSPKPQMPFTLEPFRNTAQMGSSQV